MRRKTPTFNYDLKNGSKVIYQGITQDPTVREKQHRQAGQKFTHMVVYPLPDTSDRAKVDNRRHKNASRG